MGAEELDGPGEDTEYTVEAVARITHITEEEIVVFTRAGFVSPLPSGNQADLLFDEEAIHRLRRITFLLSKYQLNRDGLHLVAEMLQELDSLRREVRFLRES